MNKKYCFISISLIGVIIFLIFLIRTDSSTYSTMCSIFIPILVGTLINYDNKQKEKFKLYYQPLYYYIKTYYDILSQPYERLTMGKKHEMIRNISTDIIKFLNNNIKYASDELNSTLSDMFFYKYENIKQQNEFQDIYNINRLIPIITKELVENYNVLNINHYLLKRYYLKRKYHEVNGIIFFYVDSFLLDISRRKQYAISLYEVIETYTKITNYRIKNHKNYYKIYRCIKHNRKKEINILIKKLKLKFNIKIAKIKKR